MGALERSDGAAESKLTPSKRALTSIRSSECKSNPTLDLKDRSFLKGSAEFMIDTGSDLNLIKEYCVNSRTWVNRNRIYNLVGISPEIIPTKGGIKTRINGIETDFHIVPNNFPISQNGILGMTFLKHQGATLSIAGIDIQLGNSELPSVNYKSFCLSARAKTLIEIPRNKITFCKVISGKLKRVLEFSWGRLSSQGMGIQQSVSPPTIPPVTCSSPSHLWKWKNAPSHRHVLAPACIHQTRKKDKRSNQ